MFLYLTFGQPHFRRQYLTRSSTTLEIQQIGNAFHYYPYILRNSAEDSWLKVDGEAHAKSMEKPMYRNLRTRILHFYGPCSAYACSLDPHTSP